MTPFPTPLVSTDWLAAHLGDPDLIVLDASWYLPVTGRDAHREYAEGHIPGARFFDLDDLSASDTSLPHMLPDDATLGAKLGALGIGPQSRVVVYDGTGANMSAGRAWWMLRTAGHTQVSVLDGGAKRWKAEGRPVTEAVATWEPVSFTSRLDSGAVRSMAEVQAAIASGSAQLVDMRSAGRFTGRDAEPRSGLSSGHMPGAKNLPFNSFVDAEGRMLPAAAIEAKLREAGIDHTLPIIATCGSGVSACTLLMAFESLGIGQVALYDGSWTEWASSGGEIVKE